MPGSNPYTQLAIGDCGHTLVAWPLISSLGGKNKRAVCDECTKTAYGIDSDESVWVYLKGEHPSVRRERTQEAAKRRATKKKPKNALIALYQEEGLF